MEKNKKNPKGIRVPPKKCHCGKYTKGFWCIMPEFLDTTAYLCNRCYDKLVYKPRVEIPKESHINLWRF